MRFLNLREIKFLAVACFLSSALIIGLAHPLQGDASQYDILGWNIRQGNGFSLSENSPFTPSMSREPAYPAFLAGMFFIFGYQYFPVQLAQVFMFILICIFVMLLARGLFGPVTAQYSLILAAFCPVFMSYPAFIYSETMAILLALSAIFSLTVFLKTRSLLWSAVAGVTLGLASLCKAMLAPFFILSFICLAFIKADNLKRKMKYLLFFTLCFGIVTSPWVLRNYRLFHKGSIALRGGKVFWMRAQKVDYTCAEIYKHIIFTFSESIGDRLYPDKNRLRTSDVYWADSLRSDEYLIELEKKGYSLPEIDDIFFKEGMVKVKLHPVKYILDTPLEFIKMLSFMHLPSLNQAYILDTVKNSNPIIRVSILLLKGIIRFSGYLIFILCVMGVYLKRKELKDSLFLILILIYTNLVHSLLFGDGRYAVVIVPFYLIFASVSIKYIMERIKVQPKICIIGE